MKDVHFLLQLLVSAWFASGPALIAGGMVHFFDPDWGVWVFILVFGVVFQYLIDRKLNIESKFDDSDG